MDRNTHFMLSSNRRGNIVGGWLDESQESQSGESRNEVFVIFIPEMTQRFCNRVLTIGRVVKVTWTTKG